MDLELTFAWVPTNSSCHQVRLLHRGLCLAQVLGCGLNAPKDLHLVAVLVLVLVHVSPQANVHLSFLHDSFREDPPAMSRHDHFLEVRTLPEKVPKVPDGGIGAILDAPEGQVEVV